VFCLNTTVVGLAAVEGGYKKPDTLDVSWTPRDNVIAARKARKFVVESVLVRVSEALNQYVSAISKLSQFASVRSRWAAGEDTVSFAEKVSELAKTVLKGEEYLIPAAVLLVHWRNRVVHKQSRAGLGKRQRELLITNAGEISSKYKGLDIVRTLGDFENGRPTLKEISSLIAMTINLVRRMDGSVNKQITKEDLLGWLEVFHIEKELAKVRAETAPEKLEAAISRVFASRAPQLFEPYRMFFINTVVT